MATYQDIQNRVGYLLKRSKWYDASSNDISSTALGMFVDNALIAIQRFIPVKQAIEQSQVLTIGPGNSPYQTTSLTYTFRYELDLWVSSAGAGITPLAPLKRYMSIQQFHKDFPPTNIGIQGVVTSSAPIGWLMYGTPMAITFGPPLDATYTFVLDYCTWLPALVNPTDTNWYTLNASDAVTYLACKEAAVWLMEDALIQMYDTMAQQKIKDVLRTLREEEVADESVLVGNLLG